MANEVILRIIGDTAQATGALNKFESETSSFFERIKKNWLGIAAAIAGAMYTVRKAWDLVELGAQAQQAEDSFRRLTESFHEDTESLLANLKRVSAGIIDDSDLMQKSVQGMMMGLKGEQLVKLLEASRLAAKVWGQDVASTFDTVVTAVGGGVRAMGPLVKMGLVTKEQYQLLNKALQQGIEDFNLYDLVILNHQRQMAAMGKITLDIKESIEALQAAIHNLKEEISKGLIPVIYGALFTFSEFDKLLLSFPALIEAALNYLGKIAEKIPALNQTAIQDLLKGTFWQDLVKTQQEASEQFRQYAFGMEESFELVGPPVEKIDKQIAKMIKNLKDRLESGTEEVDKFKYSWLEMLQYQAGLMKDEEAMIKALREKEIEAHKWLTDKSMELSLSEFDFLRMKLLEEYQLQADVIGWTEELYKTFTDNLKKIDDKEAKNKLDNLNTIREAELKHQLAMIDLAEQEFRISKPEAMQQRIDANQELLRIQEEYLSELDKLKDASAWYAQQDAIDRTRQSLLELNLALKEQTGTFKEGLIEGLNRYQRDAQTAFQGGLQIVQDVTSGMKSAFETFFDYTSEKFMDFGELATNILNDIYKAVMQALVIEPLVQGFMGLFTGGGGGGEWQGPLLPGQTYHQGGQIIYIPRFDFGGENRLVMAKVGERYITKEQNEWLTSQTRSNQNINVNMHIENKTGLPLKIAQTGSRVDEKTRVKTIIFDLIWSDPSFKSMLGAM